MNLDLSMIKTQVEDGATGCETGEDLEVITQNRTVSMPGNTFNTEEQEEEQEADTDTEEAGIVVKQEHDDDSVPGHSSVDTPDVMLCMKVEEGGLGKESNDVHRTYLCTVCDESFHNRSTLSEHGHDVHDDEPFECRFSCVKMFTWYPSSTKPSGNDTRKKTFICEFCNKSFHEVRYLTAHRRIHSDEKPFQCRDCNKTFRRAGDLKRHEHLHTGEKPFTCSTCGKMFRLSYNLTRHRLTHFPTSGNLKQFECEICNQKFTKADHLKDHRRIHTGEKPFQCPTCGQTFRQSYSLTRHHRRFHAGEDSLP